MEVLSILEPSFSLVAWQLFLIIGIIVPTIIAVFSVATSKFEKNQQIIWLLIAIFVPFGTYIYFFVGYKQRIR
jgi:hypothetical protein